MLLGTDADIDDILAACRKVSAAWSD